LIKTRYPEDGGFDYFDDAGGIEGMPEEGAAPLGGQQPDEDSFATPLAIRPEGVFCSFSSLLHPLPLPNKKKEGGGEEGINWGSGLDCMLNNRLMRWTLLQPSFRRVTRGVFILVPLLPSAEKKGKK
jgi:hypothetical protein